MFLLLLDGGDRRGPKEQLAACRARVWTRPFPYPDGWSGPCSPWLSTLSPGESWGFRRGIPAPSAPSSASAQRRLHPPARVPPGGREQVTWTNASPFRAHGGSGEAAQPGWAAHGWDTRPAGLAPVPGLLSLCPLYLVPWHLCPSRAQFRGGDPTPSVVPDRLGRLVSSCLSAPLCPSLLAPPPFCLAWPPFPMPAAAPVPCRFPAERSSVTGRVRRAEPLWARNPGRRPSFHAGSGCRALGVGAARSDTWPLSGPGPRSEVCRSSTPLFHGREGVSASEFNRDGCRLFCFFYRVFSSVAIENRCAELHSLLGEMLWAQVHYTSLLFPGNLYSFFPESNHLRCCWRTKCV